MRRAASRGPFGKRRRANPTLTLLRRREKITAELIWSRRRSYNQGAMTFSRRRFLVTGSAVIAAGSVPDWAEAFQPGRPTMRRGPRRPRRRCRGRPRWARRTPTSASTAIAASRSRRASGRCRTCRARPAAASACACWSTARGALPPPTASSPGRRAPPRSRRSPSPAPTPRWRRARSCSPTPTRSSRTWTSALQARSVRGAARHQDRRS